MSTRKKCVYKNKYYNGFVHTSEYPLTDSKRETIIKWLYDCHLVEWYVTYLMERPLGYGDVDDYIQEIYRMICEVKQEKWDYLFNQGKLSVSAYVTGMIHQQLVSLHSELWRKYRQKDEKEIRVSEEFWLLRNDEE